MKPSKITLLAAALSLAVVAGCTRTDYDDTASTEPATTTPATTPADTATTPSTTAPGTNTAATDTTGTADTGIEPAAPVPPATTTADATTAFDDMDVNNDGSISQDELSDTSSLRQQFSVADKDGNGTLSRAEVDAHRSNMMPPSD